MTVNFLTSNGFELLCNVCYWKFLMIVVVVSLHHQPLISCGAKRYFSFFFSFLVPKMSYFCRISSLIRTKYTEKKFNLVVFIAHCFTNIYSLLGYHALPAPLKLFVWKK